MLYHSQEIEKLQSSETVSLYINTSYYANVMVALLFQFDMKKHAKIT